MSLGNLLARLTTSCGRYGKCLRGRIAVTQAAIAALPRHSAEALEGRVLLSDAAPTIDLFNTSSAVFVENQGHGRIRGFGTPLMAPDARLDSGLDVGQRLRVQLVQTDVERGFVDFTRVAKATIGRISLTR